MKLFQKRPPPTGKGETETESLAFLIPAKIEIHMSAEQKALLDTPVDPRVDKIMRQMYVDQTAAEAALKAGQRPGDKTKHQVVRDPNGFWRIKNAQAPNAATPTVAAPKAPAPPTIAPSLLDGL